MLIVSTTFIPTSIKIIHAAETKQSFPKSQYEQALLNYTTCITSSASQSIQKTITGKIKFKSFLSLKKIIWDTARSHCLKNISDNTNIISKARFAGINDAGKAYIDVFLNDIFYSASTDKEKKKLEQTLELYKIKQNLIITKFGNIAHPIPGNVFMMPDGQEMIFTEKKKWVPCKFASVKCIAVD